MDHPHACGDKCKFLLLETGKLGSSPRVWGQAKSLQCCIGITRIIPTRVGTRVLPFNPASSVGDHPHACGDKITHRHSSLITRGSSPRVWGQVHKVRCFTCCPGIIPTRVGTRKFCKCLHLLHRDHPHACGDKLFFSPLVSLSIGSSPRVWGQASN